MGHVCLDKMSCSQGTHKGEFAGHASGSDDTGETTCVVSGRFAMGPLDAEHLENSALRGESSTSSDSADFDRGHRNSDEEIFSVVCTNR